MTEKTIKVPGPDHPITVEPDKAHVVVTVAGRVIADTRNALVLREASYPAGVLHSAQRCRDDAAGAHRSRDLLPIQGRLRVLQHSDWR